MTYNPQTLRWEGNESVLSAFEPVLSSARPALITHLTSHALSSHGPGSPKHSGGGALSASMKVVGNMRFDPEKMAWVSLLSKEEDEPDCFEGMDDDADDDEDGFLAVGSSDVEGRPSTGHHRSSHPRRPYSVHSRTRSIDLETLDEPLLDDPEHLATKFKADTDFARKCKLAEEGHRAEVGGWALATAVSLEREEARMWEIRKISMRAK